MTNSISTPQSVQVPNYSGVNIQIFNPAVNTGGTCPTAPAVNTQNYTTNPTYPANYYTNNYGQPAQAQQPASVVPQQPVKAEEPKKKTEKRDIVQLTDDYIKNIENYLNSQNEEIRIMGAKEVLARLQEDDSRKDDKALNALVNKMLQDPSEKVKVFAMAALDSRAATGDDLSVQLLKGMQQGKSGYGQDALTASNILLKMAGNKVQKEFAVKDTPKKAAEDKAKNEIEEPKKDEAKEAK